MAFPPVPFQEWFLRQTSTGNAALNAYVARVKADGGVVEAIGCVPLAVWDWVAPSFVGLLDLYPNAEAAYSLRKLRAAYSGSAVRVRKEVSSVSSETDIGFLADGSLDTTSLLTFASDADSGDVFVVTWYDQSLSNNATQSTAANQPKIVSGGSLVTENGKPAVDFDGSDDYFTLGGTNDAGMIGDISIFCINKSLTNVRTLVATGRTATSNANQIQWGLNQGSGVYTLETSDGTTKAEIIGSTAAGSQALTSFINDESLNLTLFVNGSSDGTVGAVSPMNDMSLPLEIGRDPFRQTLYFDGNMQELIMYNAVQTSNRTSIETNINTFYSIYP